MGVVLILAVILAMAPNPSAAKASSSSASKEQTLVTFPQVQAVVAQRCLMCHGEVVQMKNVRLDSVEGIRVQAQNMYQQVAVMRQMPMNNATGITEEERALIARWYQAGAKLE